MAELGDDGEPDSYVDVDVQIKTEAEYGLEGPDEGELCLISDRDSEREQGGGGGDRQYRHPGGNERDMTIKKLWRRIRRLEEQVTSCLENQPLLYQVMGKCKAIEQRQKLWKVEVEKRLKEISNGLKSQGLEIEASDRNRTATKPSLKRKHRSTASPPISESDIDLSDNDNNDIYNDLAVEGSDGPDSDYEPQKRVANSNIKNRKFTHNSISASSFRSPQNSTERNNSFPCKLCPEQDQVFRTAKDLAEHYCHQHPHPKNQPPVQRAKRGRPRKSATTNSGKPEPDAKQYATVHADDSFPDILDLIDTVVSQAVDNEVGKFLCPDGCGNVSRTKNLLRRHLTSCRRLRPFKCDECDKDFQTKGRLNEHKRCAHEKVRNVDCPICGRSMDKYQIKYHVMLHYKEKPHLCDTCGAGFTRPDTLRVHRRTHTEERPFGCPHSGCSKQYKNDTSLNRHFAKTGHSAGIEGKSRGHVCDVCGWAFRSAGGLKTHMERHQRETNLKGRSGSGASSKSKPTALNEPPPDPQIGDSE